MGQLQSHHREGSPVGKRSLRWEGFVEKVGFEPGVKEWSMTTAGMMREMGWQVDEEVNRNKIGEADGMNLEVDSWDEGMHIWMRDLHAYRRSMYCDDLVCLLIEHGRYEQGMILWTWFNFGIDPISDADRGSLFHVP